jgi:hypothetical protein
MLEYVFSIVLGALTVHPFVKNRKRALSKLLIQGPWNVFNKSFMNMVDVECKICAREYLKISPALARPSEIILWILIGYWVLQVAIAYMASQSCDPWIVSAYILSILYRMPLLSIGMMKVKNYVDNPALIGRVA